MSRAIQRDDVLNSTERGLAVFRHYMPIPFEPEKMFRNPCYDDTKASAHIHLSRKTNTWILQDFGDDTYSMDCFSFCAWACGLDAKRDFSAVLARIDADLGLGLSLPPSERPSRPLADPLPATAPHIAEAPCYEVEYAPWEASHLAFWAVYGIDKATLIEYNVRCVGRFSSVGSSGKPYSITPRNGEPLFAYDQQRFVKIYRPHSTGARFLYGGEKPRDYCFGLSQLPHRGRLLVITGGEKDVLSLASRGFAAVCFNSETCRPSEALASRLRAQFDSIAVLYDMDSTGIAQSSALVEMLGGNAVRVDLPLDGSKSSKDVSDFFRAGGTRDALMELIHTALRHRYASRMVEIGHLSLSMDRPPREAMTLFSYKHVALGKPGQLVCISGKPGVGKTHLMGAMISGCLPDRKLTGNTTLGIDVRNNERHAAVLHFDTEQSEAQIYSNALIALRRAGLDRKPDFYRCFPLLGAELTAPELRARVEEIVRVCFWEHGGVHAAFIDGVADLVCNPNDEQESTAVVQWLLGLAERYETCVVCMMHLLPNGEKIRGHLGSILERKCSSILAVERSQHDRNLYRATKLREGNVLAIRGVEFGWDEARGMMWLDREESREEFLQHYLSAGVACVRRFLERSGARAAYGLEEFEAFVSLYMNIDRTQVADFLQFIGRRGLVTVWGDRLTVHADQLKNWRSPYS